MIFTSPRSLASRRADEARRPPRSGGGGSAFAESFVRMLAFGLQSVFAAETRSMFVDHPFAGWFLASVDLLLHALEPLMGLAHVAGTEGGEVDLGVEQITEVGLVRFEHDGFGDLRRQDFLGITLGVAAH